ncbi:hypothetical protein LCP963914a_9888 [Penicillium roqueforti]|nr:hypothetical protein LCP963914a_9888 [Penicillium roqueforti]
MIATVAVAGATGAVGRTLVEQIRKENRLHVVALTRREDVEFPIDHVQYVQVDYDDGPALVQHLERNEVHTVICAIGMLGDDCSEAQLNLIKAADRANTVKRFMTSEFGYFTSEERRDIDPGVDWFLTAADLLKSSRLTYTRPVCGVFMDFLGMPYSQSNIPPMNIVVDVLNREAHLPGDGNSPLTMIHSYDAATLVAKLLEAEEWSEFSFCNGEDTTLSEVLKVAEEVRGGRFEVTYLKPEDIDKGTIPTLKIPEGSDIEPKDLLDYSVFGIDLEISFVVQRELARIDKILQPAASSLSIAFTIALQPNRHETNHKTCTVGEIASRFSKKYNYERAKCEDPKIIREWFNLVRNPIDENGILDDDIYNFDETGFAMGLTATARIAARSDTGGRRCPLYNLEIVSG